MFGWIKRVLYGEEEESSFLSCTLHQFLNADTNYKKKCLFIEAEVEVSPHHIRVVNLAFTGEQDDVHELLFPITEALDLTGYQIIDEDTVISGVKWRNLSQDSCLHAKIVGVEFSDLQSSQAFKSAVCRALHELAEPDIPFSEIDMRKYCEEEGYESCLEEAQFLTPVEHTSLVANGGQPASQPWTDVPLSSSNREFTSREQMLIFLQDIYTLDKLMFVAAAHFFERDALSGDDILLQENVCFMLVRPQRGVFIIEIVKGDFTHQYQLTRSLSYHIDLEANHFEWVEESSRRLHLAQFAESIEGLEGQLIQSLFEISLSQADDVLEAEELKWVTSANYPDLDNEVLSEESQAVSEAAHADWECGKIARLDYRADNSDRPASILNSLSTQSLVYNRTFVSRGPAVSVYQEQHECLDRLFEIQTLIDKRGTRLNPRAMQLHSLDRNMLLLGEDRRYIYNVDVERGQVVNEWQPGNSMKVQCIAPTTKFGTQTSDPTFLVVSPKTIALMDPRVSEPSKIVQAKTYAKSCLFSSVASSSSGNLAVGSSNGDIRLYKQAGQNAKNLFPGICESLISTEVSASGYWVLTTSQLALYLLQVGNDSYNGFTERLGPQRQSPILLTLKPHDISRLRINEVSFTPAKFDSSDSSNETSIVTTTGPFMVIWSLNDIKKGKHYKYEIKRLEETAVGAQFIYGRKDVIVTMPNCVQLVNL